MSNQTPTSPVPEQPENPDDRPAPLAPDDGGPYPPPPPPADGRVTEPLHMRIKRLAHEQDREEARAMLAGGGIRIERSERPGVTIAVAPGATVRTGEIVGGNLIR